MQLFSDNKAPLEISWNLVQHDKTKHFVVDRHFIKEKIENGVLDVSYVPTKEQIADVLTKGLTRSNFDYMVSKLDMLNIFGPTWGGV